VDGIAMSLSGLFKQAVQSLAIWNRAGNQFEFDCELIRYGVLCGKITGALALE
jgi:hypothetical protein